jgi:hypothetical protein
MEPASPDSRDLPPAARQQPDTQAGQTPNPDMQAEDAGTTDSGTAATGAMKQSSKTAAESGDKR